MTQLPNPVPNVHQTSRLALRPFVASDVHSLYAIQSNRAAMRYTFVATSLVQYTHRLNVFEESRAVHGFAPWVVLDRIDANVVGWGGLNIDPFDPGWGVEVSYFFDPAHWGRGLASELVAYSLRHAFMDLDLPQVSAFVMPQNAGSIHVLEKCGFNFLGYEPRLERNQYRVQRSELSRTLQRNSS